MSRWNRNKLQVTKSEVSCRMVESMMLSQFSKDGKYFAFLSSDGKLKIWETATNIFKQEFTPNLHLATPSTCLHWIDAKSQTPWKKKKRRPSGSFSAEPSYFIALGTNYGALLLYSFASAQVESTVNSNTSNSISCLTWEPSQDVYAGVEHSVIQFDFRGKSVRSKWKAGNEKINAILLVPNRPELLTASKTIKLWNLQTKEQIKTFTGHSSDVAILHCIPSTNGVSYFISASKGDRFLSCWNLTENLKEKNTVANLVMEDIACSVSVVEGPDNSSNLAAVTRSGVVHIYQHTLNGKSAKPVKPKVTVQVATDNGQNKDLVTPIPIISAFFHTDLSIMVTYGNSILLTFENMVPNSYEKFQCLIRKDPQEILSTKQNEVTKSKEPLVDNNVDYLSPFVTSKCGLKRKKNKDTTTEVPMEQRLENLTLNKLESGVPRQDNVAHLLVQGLHSKDKTILSTVFMRRDENTIRNTIKRLPMQIVIPLLTELVSLVEGKTLACQTGVVWLRYLVQIHAGQLLAHPKLVEMIEPVLGCIENRLSLLAPISRLRGRLDLLVSQISDSKSEDVEVDQSLLTFRDIDSSDSELDDNIEVNMQSESEDEWVEEENSVHDSNAEENDLEITDENNVSDLEMSL